MSRGGGVGSPEWDSGGVGQEGIVKTAISSSDTAIANGSDYWYQCMGCYSSSVRISFSFIQFSIFYQSYTYV